MPGPQPCYARRQRAEPFRPAPRPPPLMGRLLSRASPAQKAPHTVKSWPSLRGLKGPDGPCVAARFRSTTRQLGRGGLPPSLAPLVHDDSRQSVGAGHARPATLLCPPSTGIHPLTPAAAWGRPPYVPLLNWFAGRGLAPRGASGTPPPTAFTTTLLPVVGGGFIPPGKAFLTPRSSHPRQNRVSRSGLKSHASAWAKSHPPGASLSDFPR